MAKQNAVQDKQFVPALLVHSGTADTADTIRATGQTTGAQDVHVTGGTFALGTVTDISATGFEGGTVSVGTTAVELTFTNVTKSIMVTADHNNGTMIYLGGTGVTQAGAASVVRLDPGESIAMDLNDDSAAVYAVAGTTGQKVYKLALF